MTEAISIKQVYDELKRMERDMVTKKELQSLIDTIGVLRNPDTMKQIASSMEDIKKGNVKEVSSIKDMMSEI